MVVFGGGVATFCVVPLSEVKLSKLTARQASQSSVKFSLHGEVWLQAREAGKCNLGISSVSLIDIGLCVDVNRTCPRLHSIFDDSTYSQIQQQRFGTMQWYQSLRLAWNFGFYDLSTARVQSNVFYSRLRGILWQVLNVWPHSLNRNSEQFVHNDLRGILENVLNRCASRWFTI